MVGVRNGCFKGIAENCERLGEYHAVTSDVRSRLAWIPLKLHGTSVARFEPARFRVFGPGSAAGRAADRPL